MTNTTVLYILSHKLDLEPDRIVYADDSGTLKWCGVDHDGNVYHGSGKQTSMWTRHTTMSGRDTAEVLEQQLRNWKRPTRARDFSDSRFLSLIQK